MRTWGRCHPRRGRAADEGPARERRLEAPGPQGGKGGPPGLTLLLLLFVSLVQPRLLLAQRPTPEVEGQELAAELRAQYPVEDLATSGTLKTRVGDGPWQVVPVKMRVVLGARDWTTVYETSGNERTPAERLIVRHALDQPTQYRDARAPAAGAMLPAPLALTTAEADRSFAGTAFWLTDLGLEFFQWPGQRLVKREMRKGRACRVLESINPQPASGHYARVLSWIDLETTRLLRAEAYDGQGRMLKEFSVRSLKKVEGRWQLKAMEIRNAKTDARTRVEFDLELPAGK